MKSRLLLSALMIALVALPADAAPRKKARPKAKPRAAAPAPKAYPHFGTFEKLEGRSWQDAATGRLATYRWLEPGERMIVEYDLPTGSKEEAVAVYDKASGDIILTYKDVTGREISSTARRAADGALVETTSRDDTAVRNTFRLAGPDLLAVETATLQGGTWQPGATAEHRRVAPEVAAELRSAARQQMLQRWGALAGVADKSWRMELKGQELLQSFAWEVPGEVLVQRDTITGRDPAKYGTVTIYRYDAASSRIVSSSQTGQAKAKGATASVEADGTVVITADGAPGNVTYVRMLGPTYYHSDAGKVGKKGFASKTKATYTLETPQAVEARLAAAAQAQQLASAKAAEAAAAKAARKAAGGGGGGLLGSLAGAAGSMLGGGNMLGAVTGAGAGDAMGAGLLGMIAGAAGGGDAGALAAALGGGGGAQDALSAAILAQSLGGGGGGLGAAAGQGGGLLGALTGKSGLVGGLAAGALSGMMGGDANDAAGLQLMFAAIKSEDPGALMQAMQMMQGAGATAGTAGAVAAGTMAPAATGGAGGMSKGTTAPGSYPTRPNILAGTTACRGYTNANYKEYFAANQNGPDVQLHTMCAAAFNYYSMYLNAIKQGYSQADSNITYGVFEQAAATAINFHKTAR